MIKAIAVSALILFSSIASASNVSLNYQFRDSSTDNVLSSKDFNFEYPKNQKAQVANYDDHDFHLEDIFYLERKDLLVMTLIKKNAKGDVVGKVNHTVFTSDGEVCIHDFAIDSIPYMELGAKNIENSKCKVCIKTEVT